MKKLLDLKDCEYGWSHNGVKSWGKNWPTRAETEALEQIRNTIKAMVNLGELETFTKSDVSHNLGLEKSKTGFKIALGDSMNEEERVRWLNKNNFLVDVGNVRATKQWSDSHYDMGKRSWKATATMLYDVRLYGKE